MFLLILVMTLICGLGEATLFQTHPVDTFAILGGSASFSCTPVRVLCGGQHTLYWQRGPSMIPSLDRNIFSGTETSRRFAGKERYTVSSSDCTWTLHIRDIQTVDERYYSCYNNGYSKVARLTIVDLIYYTTVVPSRMDKYTGENAYFSCHIKPLNQHVLEYTWYVKTQGSYEWKEFLENNIMIEFHNNKNIMTMLRLGIEMNGSMIQCSVHNGSSLLTPGTGHTGLIFVRPAEEAMETTSEMVIVDRQSTPSAPQTSSPLLTKKQDPDRDCNNPSSGSTDSTVILVRWSLAAVFICLFISLLLYVVVIKRRSKAHYNSTRVVHTTQDEDAEAYEEMETQLHGQAASIGHKETAPSSYQELIFK